jgi:hypothetical protein
MHSKCMAYGLTPPDPVSHVYSTIIIPVRPDPLTYFLLLLPLLTPVDPNGALFRRRLAENIRLTVSR